MTYSERIAVRLGQFQVATEELPHGGTADFSRLGVERESIETLLTINWAVAASLERGLPEEPYQILLAQLPTVANHGCILVPDITLDRSISHRRHIDSLLVAPGPRPWGVLCVGFVASGAKPGTMIFCRAMDGTEIAGSRREIGDGPGEFVLSGPNICEICANGDVTLQGVILCTATQEMLGEYSLIAKVGPSFEPSVKPASWPYDDQSYLQNVGLSPQEALQLRQMADSLARANTPSPTAQILIDEVHQRDPATVSLEIEALPPVSDVCEDLVNLLREPDRAYEVDGNALPASSNTDTLSLTYAQILQLLARQGPVEALTLGNAVTLPMMRAWELGPFVPDESSAYALMQQGRMPYPLIVVGGKYFDATLNAVVEEFAIGGLDFRRSGEVQPVAELGKGYEPAGLDDPPTADLRVRLGVNASTLVQFVSRQSASGEEIFDRVSDDRPDHESVGPPLGRHPYADAPDELNLAGAPVIALGRIALPVASPGTLGLGLYPRDMFGRWPGAEFAECPLPTRPVDKPALHSCEPQYRSDGTIAVHLVFEWDRKIRTLANVEIGLAIQNGVVDQVTPALKPNDGLLCPAFDAPTKLRISFDRAGNPFDTANLPLGVRIERIERLAPPATVPDIGAGAIEDSLLYELTIPLGTVPDVMALNADPDAGFAVKLVGDAAEHVSGTRRSDEPVSWVSSKILDPRPPVLDVRPWKIAWTGLPNGETNRAHISLPLPKSVDGPAAHAFQVWRSSETAVLDFALSRHFDDPDEAAGHLATVRRETNMAVRLGLIQRLIEPRLADPNYARDLSAIFRADSSIAIPGDAHFADLTVTAQQSGFEFIWFTAVSRDGIQSDKSRSPSLSVVAVPQAPTPQAPILRIISSDDNGHLETAGLCLAIVSYHRPFDAGQARFFWDHGNGISDSSELLFELPVLAELTNAEAAAYVADIADFIEARMPFAHTRIFALMPNQTAARHHFGVELKIASQSANVADQIPSPRSQVESLFLKS